MLARAVVRHVRMSPRKMRIIADMVRGKRVDEAMNLLRVIPKKAAVVIRKIFLARYLVAHADHEKVKI